MPDYGYYAPPKYDKIYKAGSNASILSENSFRSETSVPKLKNESDSSLGDSLFSYQSTNHHRYFGSSESCRFGFECRRCSLDGEKCSFSDNCRYDRCHNCDCSSSYFSSDFDETTNFSRKSSTRCSTGSKQNRIGHHHESSRYADDFNKHLSNVKRDSRDAVYSSSRKSRGAVGSTSTVENSSSSDHNNTYAAAMQHQKQQHAVSIATKGGGSSGRQSRSTKDDAYGTVVTSAQQQSSSSSGTLKRRRNKTTGTIPKMATNSTLSREQNASELNLSQLHQFQTIEQLEEDRSAISLTNIASANDDEVFVAVGDAALKPVARRVSRTQAGHSYCKTFSFLRKFQVLHTLIDKVSHFIVAHCFIFDWMGA